MSFYEQQHLESHLSCQEKKNFSARFTCSSCFGIKLREIDLLVSLFGKQKVWITKRIEIMFKTGACESQVVTSSYKAGSCSLTGPIKRELRERSSCVLQCVVFIGTHWPLANWLIKM